MSIETSAKAGHNVKTLFKKIAMRYQEERLRRKRRRRTRVRIRHYAHRPSPAHFQKSMCPRVLSKQSPRRLDANVDVLVVVMY